MALRGSKGKGAVELDTPGRVTPAAEAGLKTDNARDGDVVRVVARDRPAGAYHTFRFAVACLAGGAEDRGGAAGGVSTLFVLGFPAPLVLRTAIEPATLAEWMAGSRAGTDKGQLRFRRGMPGSTRAALMPDPQDPSGWPRPMRGLLPTQRADLWRSIPRPGARQTVTGNNAALGIASSRRGGR